MTVLEAIQKSTEFLARKGVETPRLQSELLLGHVLKTPRLRLYLDFGRVLKDGETEELRELVRRRGNREPLQHIVGSTSFCGLEVKVNCKVLVPRPETELLAEEGWKFLADGDGKRFLDFGTGSGCIAVALCHKAMKARGVALDKSEDALAVARENAEAHGVRERLDFLQSDAFAGLGPGESFDLIVSNPPYIPGGEIEGLQEEVRRHDPRSALDGGEDGLDFYRLLARESFRHLSAGGRLMVEFGDGQEGAIAEEFERCGWTVDRVLKDLTSRPRVMTACRR